MNDHPSDAPLDPPRSTLLDLRLDALRRGIAAESAPDALEAALATRFRARARRPRWTWALPPLAAAAAVALVAWIVRAPVPVNSPAVPPVAQTPDDEPFVALRSLDRIALEPAATVRETEFPRALLAGWGLPVSPDRAAEPVRAQVLYSDAGEPLAVRLLQ